MQHLKESFVLSTCGQFRTLAKNRASLEVEYLADFKQLKRVLLLWGRGKKVETERSSRVALSVALSAESKGVRE